jgi:apolipoprotein N-acyltransferase
VLALAFYPGPFGYLAWVALIRPIMIIRRLTGTAAFTAAYFFGFFFTLFGIYWVAMVTIPGMIAAVVIVAAYYAVILAMFSRLYRWRTGWGMAALPFLWVGMEYFRTLSEFAFPWSDLGYTQSYSLNILQIVSVTSVHGLSWLIVLVNVLLTILVTKTADPARRVTAFLGATGVVVALFLYGWIAIPVHPVPGQYPVALLQGGVPLDIKWTPGNEMHSFRTYDSLAQSVRHLNPRLYVWPETSVPCYLSHDETCHVLVRRIVRDAPAYHLVGALGAEVTPQKTRRFNSAYQFAPSGLLIQRYDKVKLVPFSEHVPYQDHLGFLSQDYLRQYLTFLDRPDVQWWSDFYPGDSVKIFHTDDAAYGVLICFESTFPEFSRQLVRTGSEFLVGITNDTWFGTSVGIHMHSRIFVTRMVENRSWGVRVANTGLSYVVDEYGRQREALDVYAAQAIVAKVGRLDSYSVFTQYGDLAGRLSFLITLSIAGILVTLWLAHKIRSRFTGPRSS